MEEFPSIIDDLLDEFAQSRRQGRPETIEEALVRLGEVTEDLRRRVLGCFRQRYENSHRNSGSSRW